MLQCHSPPPRLVAAVFSPVLSCLSPSLRRSVFFLTEFRRSVFLPRCVVYAILFVPLAVLAALLLEFGATVPPLASPFHPCRVSAVSLLRFALCRSAFGFPHCLRFLLRCACWFSRLASVHEFNVLLIFASIYRFNANRSPRRSDYVGNFLLPCWYGVTLLGSPIPFLSFLDVDSFACRLCAFSSVAASAWMLMSTGAHLPLGCAISVIVSPIYSHLVISLVFLCTCAYVSCSLCV